MNPAWHDLRYGIRSLLKYPGFTTIAAASLAIGIGAGTAIFSLANAILLRSLPVPNPHELRILEWSGANPKIRSFTGSQNGDAAGHITADSLPYPVFRSLRDQSAAQADIFGHATLYNMTVRARRAAFTAEGLMVSDNFFSGLGARPLLGRLLGSDDNRPGAIPTAVISYAWWEKQFDLDPGVLGQSIMLNGNGFAVVGVLPRGFPGVNMGGQTDFYVPMSAQPQLMPGWPATSAEYWWVRLMARLKPGANDRQFQAALDVAFAREMKAVMSLPRILVQDGRAGLSFSRNFFRSPLQILLGIVGIVILVTCANLAGLSLARGAARQHEFAVRAAIGAGRWRLVQQSLTESLLLAFIGGGLGILIALWGKAAISRLLSGSSEGLHYDTSLDLTVLGFALAVTLVTALLAGLLPALRAAHVDPLAGLKDRAAHGKYRLRSGKVLVAAQIGLSVLLLTGAGLYVRTLVNLLRIDPGFATDKLLLFQLNPRAAGYRDAQITGFYEKVQYSLGTIPGVRAVALTQFKLLGGTMSGGSFFTFPDHPAGTGPAPHAHRLTVGETFFTTMRIPLLIGRGFGPADIDSARKVIIVNETFARKYMSNENPMGQRIKANGSDWEIVGVCGDAKYRDIKEPVPPTVYFSFRQSAAGSAFLALRTELPPLALATAARKAVAAIDPNVPLAQITTQDQVRDQRIAQERMFAMLCSALALLAVLLSTIGVYGLMAFTVARQTRDFGIRIALGAKPGRVAREILHVALLLAVAGVAVGVPVALAAARIIRSKLYGVEPNDPVTLVGAAILLPAVAVVAAWIPARRASHVDPIVALRYE
jgi:predicted permease